jgi:hypothetical protein
VSSRDTIDPPAGGGDPAGEPWYSIFGDFEERLGRRCNQIKEDERFEELVDKVVGPNCNPVIEDLARLDLALLICEYLFRKFREAVAPRRKTVKEDLRRLGDLLGEAGELYVALMRNGAFMMALDQYREARPSDIIWDWIKDFKVEDELYLYSLLPTVETRISQFLSKLSIINESLAANLGKDIGGRGTVAHTRATADAWLCVEGLKTLACCQPAVRLTKNSYTVTYISCFFDLVRDYDDPRDDWDSGEKDDGERARPDVDSLVSWAAPRLRALQQAGELHRYDKPELPFQVQPTAVQIRESIKAEQELQAGPRPRRPRTGQP